MNMRIPMTMLTDMVTQNTPTSIRTPTPTNTGTNTSTATSMPETQRTTATITRETTGLTITTTPTLTRKRTTTSTDVESGPRAKATSPGKAAFACQGVSHQRVECHYLWRKRVIMGAGISILPEVAMAEEDEQGKLVRLRWGEHDLEVTIFMISSKVRGFGNRGSGLCEE
jgi:hypothetical protein